MWMFFGLLFGVFVLAMIKPSWLKISSRKKVLMWVGGVLSGVVVFFIIIAIVIDTEKSPEQRAKEKEAAAMKVSAADKKRAEEEAAKNNTCLNYDDNKIRIIMFAQDAVRQGLKNPNGADFPMENTANFIFSNNEKVLKNTGAKCAFVVSSYVDATNGFGATIRTPWIVEIHSDGVGYSVSSVIMK